jgi:hypothetical protein
MRMPATGAEKKLGRPQISGTLIPSTDNWKRGLGWGIASATPIYDTLKSALASFNSMISASLIL